MFLFIFMNLKILFFFLFDCTTWHAGSEFPNQGWNPCPLQWKHRALTTAPPGKSLKILFDAVKKQKRIEE